MTNMVQLSFFYEDFSTAGGLCATLDNQIQSDSVAAGGQDYATITSLSVRQAYGALQMAGTPDAMYVFLKEISSDGNIQTVSVFRVFLRLEATDFIRSMSSSQRTPSSFI